MDHPRSQLTERSGSIRLQIDYTIFEPQTQVVDSLENRDSSNLDSGSLSRTTVHAPEKKLTLLALQLAVLQKMATGLGALGSIWATVVLLGGNAIKLTRTDFWFITIILLIEAARIFSRSHELEWQHQSTWSIADAGIYGLRVLKSSSSFVIRAVKEMSGPLSESQSQEIKEKNNEAKLSNRLTRTVREHRDEQ
ncbi:hypothetical protein NE237_012275 [Protea cynaroides]|uniref:Uncharacterized protein n=1 Tax=Protea cynaroides TaxID=273540 RepID=A0A9Q0GWK4_9MAGN|nr:hypothetical protein NE237_012275 [Protea cynaroides]